MPDLNIAVIGAGPAGTMAALEAAAAGAAVSLYDTNPSVGRKLLVTGNGRCNISHVGARAMDYACDAPDSLATILSLCGHAELEARLVELGIPIYATPDGWCYPLSDSAATVADALAAALDLAGVAIHLQTQVRDLTVERGGLRLVAGNSGQADRFERVVVATGGKAHPALGSTGQFFSILERLGHTILPIHPALVSIEGDMRPLHRLQGVRLDAGLSLHADGELLGQTVGNVMFTQSGLSGPAAMDLSHLVHAAGDRETVAALDLLAVHRSALLSLIRARRTQAVPVTVVLGAVLPAKVPPVVMALANLETSLTLDRLTEAQLNRLLRTLGAVTIRVAGTRSMQFAQLSTGGVPLAEIEPASMASRTVPGLYLAGEVLNVLGPCGGYNLLFAQGTGILAGRAAGRQ